jgi:hypothetical protein
MRELALSHLSVLALISFGISAQGADPLPSWHDTASKQAIFNFVDAVTRPGSPDFVPASERIAVFDNDGCLWSEQPMYFQAFFVFDRIRQLAPQHPEWQRQEPFASVLKGDLKSALAGGEHALIEMAMATHAGTTTEAFEEIVAEWIATARHPKTGRLFTEMVFQPMLEVLAYLRANGFKTFIVSGGGIEFMRPWTERVYGVPPEQVIGSSIKTKFEMRDGQPVLMRLPEMNFIDDKEGKPVGIQMHIGRRPIAAFGNSDGDLQMLQWTAAGRGPRFCLYVHHTDAEREWAYDRQSHIGRLDRGLDEARARGWTVVDMKKDWMVIYPPVAAGVDKAKTMDVPLVAQWAGDYPVAELIRLPKAQRRSGVGCIDDRDRFESVWKVFKAGEPVPQVDFDRNLVVFVRNTEFYNRIRIGKAILTDGVLSLLAMETRSAMPIEDQVAMSLAVVPRAGIASIQAGADRIALGGP